MAHLFAWAFECHAIHCMFWYACTVYGNGCIYPCIMFWTGCCFWCVSMHEVFNGKLGVMCSSLSTEDSLKTSHLCISLSTPPSDTQRKDQGESSTRFVLFYMLHAVYYK